MTLDELTERIRRTLDRSGVIAGAWADIDDLARTIAIDIDREESAHVDVIRNDDDTIHRIEHGDTVVYYFGDRLSLPGDYDGEIDRDTLPPLLAILNHIHRTGL